MELPKVTLLSNWLEILTKAWSVWFSALAALLIGLSQAVAAIQPDLIGLTPEQSGAISGILLGVGGIVPLVVILVRPLDQGIGKGE